MIHDTKGSSSTYITFTLMLSSVQRLLLSVHQNWVG